MKTTGNIFLIGPMGAGKTTVIGPLLALLLGDGKSLVAQVVPAALLEMSRDVMRRSFAAIVPKPVLTFEFDRHTPVDEALVSPSPRSASRLAPP